tara:strand:- start:242 stop:916 length:675 start_codon:yes stop_codon:yes gene_type:complete
MKNSDFIVIIPARKNSKRLKEKNTKLLNGKPLISYTIEYAIKYFIKENIWVNTNDQKVERIAKSYNIKVYKRKENLSTDKTSTSEVIVDQIKDLEHKKINFSTIILLQPTNPFRNNFDLQKILKFYLSNKLNSLMTVSSAKLKLGSIDKLSFKPINYVFEQSSQNIDELYFENGQLYICNKKTIKDHKRLISDDVYPYKTEGIESIVDIDYQEDFDFAELILRK